MGALLLLPGAMNLAEGVVRPLMRRRLIPVRPATRSAVRQAQLVPLHFHARGVGPVLTGLGGSGRVWVGRNPLQSLDVRLPAVCSGRRVVRSSRRLGPCFLDRRTSARIASASPGICVEKLQDGRNCCRAIRAHALSPDPHRRRADIRRRVPVIDLGPAPGAGFIPWRPGAGPSCHRHPPV